jgi:hypothetical protein
MFPTFRAVAGSVPTANKDNPVIFPRDATVGHVVLLKTPDTNGRC